MRYPLIRKRKPFAGRSRRRQRDAFIRVRNRIRQAAPILGGTFFTRDYLHGENGWADIYFLGRKAPIFYSVTLETTRHAYKERVLDAAWRRSYELVPEPESFSPDHAVRDARTDHYVVSAREPVRYYGHGIGLHATLDVPFLAIEAINAFVARFLADEAALPGATDPPGDQRPRS